MSDESLPLCVDTISPFHCRAFSVVFQAAIANTPQGTDYTLKELIALVMFVMWL